MHEAIVVGGGLAGPATALALERAGIRSVVYEADEGVPTIWVPG